MSEDGAAAWRREELFRTRAQLSHSPSLPDAWPPFHGGCRRVPPAQVNRALVIIPAFNEAGRVGGVVRQVCEACRADVLVVDDGSSDDTAREAAVAGATVVSHPFNLGYGAALQTGYKFARARDYPCLVQMDADGQHDPSHLPDLLAPIQANTADLVIGSRFKQDSGYEMGSARSTGRIFFQRLLVFCGGPEILDPTSGMQALSRRVYEFYCSDFYPSDFPDIDVLLMLHRRGFRIEEVPVQMAPSPEGRKPMHTGFTTIYYPYKMLLSTFRSWRAPRGGRVTP